jgi:hypothetical protein
MPDTSLPECVPVLLAEQLIFCLAGGGLLVMVGGPHWTLPPMPASALLAAALAFLVSLGAFFFRVALPDSSHKTAAALQQLAMAWIATYTVQYVVFALVLRLHDTDDDKGAADNPFILLFNADRVQPYGLGATSLHMVVSLVLSVVLLALFTSTHYFLRDHQARGVEFSLLTVLFFAESQFFLFHSEDQAAAVRQNEHCTRVLCDVVHTAVALGVLAGLMAEHFAMDVVRERFRRNPSMPLAIGYLAIHVIGVPVGGFVAVHVVRWLQHPGLYVANLVFLSMLLLERLYHVWGEWRLASRPDPVSTNPLAGTPPTSLHQTIFSGTKQPRYFFKRVGGHKTPRRKYD